MTDFPSGLSSPETPLAAKGGGAIQPSKSGLALALPNAEAIVQTETARFTVLTPALIRMEYSATGAFRDAATQTVTNRAFPVPKFQVRRFDSTEGAGAGVEIITDRVRLVYAGGRFTSHSLSVFLRQKVDHAVHAMWYYGDPPFSMNPTETNLGGTARTLDGVDGEIALDPGLLSTAGVAVLDDSRSLPMTADGWVAPRTHAEEDLYFFGYGHQYKEAIADFFKLSGESPLLPREVFGNWWSRYHRYSAQEYTDLLDDFEDRDVPLSVAVVDMDWHLVDIDPGLGSGWTGYTWNKELFPDPASFLADIHSRGMLATLNVHPADGVRAHEDAYEPMAKALGFDPQTLEAIPFDIADREFAAAYFQYLHHPHENDGVDFWWVDWQAGTESAIPGLDPLWMLNYLHYQDNARDGKRPLTFSRYAGPGSHRYPIGFSGDTIVSWESLQFQPRFTATAANIGYFWWSHDIGGHMQGVKDNELATRWVQFGVFSPVMRLHSSNSPFASKEPRMYGPVAEAIMTDFLQLRHHLVPYIYSAMWRSHRTGLAPVRPMYHDFPDERAAYSNLNQYFFGPDLLVAPVVSPRGEKSELARTDVWLPEGLWTDIFTGTTYRGDRTVSMYRPLESIPVLARPGSIIPLASDPFAPVGKTPKKLDLVVVPVSDGQVEVIEEDGSVHPEPAVTTFQAAWEDGNLHLTVTPSPVAGSSVERKISIVLIGHKGASRVSIDGQEVNTKWRLSRFGARASLGKVDYSSSATIVVEGLIKDSALEERAVWDMLDSAEISFQAKEDAWQAYLSADDPRLAIPVWLGLEMPENLKGALVELVTAH